MADQAPNLPTDNSVTGDPITSSDIPSQSLPDKGQLPPSTLLSAKLLDGLLPLNKDGVSPLRVRKRGVRRLQYQEEPYEYDGDTGDLGEHSLADSYIGKTAPSVAPPDLQPPVYLPKRLVSLRRKREASPIPAPNLIDALTNLLSPPSGGQSAGGTSSSKVLGLGILNGGSPLTGLGILTPASENDPDPFSKDGPAGDFFVDEDDPPPMDQSTPSFPKDEDFHHVPNDDGPSRQQSGYRGSADSKGTNAGNKNGSAYDSGKKTNGYESGKGTSTNGASKGSSSQNASKGETKGKDVDSKGSMSEENDMWDKKFEAQSGKQADPLASLDSIGDFFNDDPTLPSQGAPSRQNPSATQGGSKQTTEQPKAGKDTSAPPPPAAGPDSQSKEQSAKPSPPPDKPQPPAQEPAYAPPSDTQTTGDQGTAPASEASKESSAAPADAPSEPAPDSASSAPAASASDGQDGSAATQEPPPQQDSNDQSAPQKSSAQPSETPQDTASQPAPTADNNDQSTASTASQPGDSAAASSDASQPSEPPAADPPPPREAASQPAAGPASEQETGNQPEGEAPSAEEAPQARRRALGSIPQPLQQLRMRRSADIGRRASVKPRAPAPPASIAVESPYASSTPTFSSPVFASSPLSRAWKPSQAVYSPTIYASPFSSYEDSPVVGGCTVSGQPCITTTPVLSSPVGAFGANSMASPILEGTPRMNQSPIMSPLLASSRRFASPSTSFEGASFNTQAQYGSSNGQQAGPGTPGSGFYNAVIATSIVGAAMCMGAFGILAWLLFRRRTPYHRPTISHPVLTYSSNDAHGHDEDEEKPSLPSQQGSHFRHAGAPSIPESVLPSNTWRPSMQYPVDGFGNSDQTMRETVHSLQMQQSYQPQPEQPMPMSPDLTRNMPGALVSGDRGDFYPRQSDPGVQRKGSLSRYSSVPQPAPALVRSGSSREERQRTRFADEVPHQAHSLPSPRYHGPGPIDGAQQYQYGPSEDMGADSPVQTMRARSSSKSSMSSQQASWELRKAAILASAQTSSPGMQHAPSSNTAPVNLSDTEVKSTSAEPTSPPSTTLSNSVSLVMLDKQMQDLKTSTTKQRPVSQDASAARNKLKKGSPYSGKKARPITIGAAPPSILVTNHPQALIPPPSPQPTQRTSVYSLTGTLPYLASASQSMTSFGTTMAQDDISLIDPIYKRQSAASFDNRSSLAEGSVFSEESANRCSLAESCRSETAVDPTAEEEQAKRSQRRRTLLESVYKQEEEQLKASNSQLSQRRTSTEDPFTQDGEYQTPGKPGLRLKNKPVIPQPLPPLTPPYTPKELPPIRPTEDLSVETPTRRSRSVSAGAPAEGPSLDVDLTRFSDIDLGSEFSLSKFGSAGATNPISRDKNDKAAASTAHDSGELSGQQNRKSVGQSSKRSSMHGSNTTTTNGETAGKSPRRVRASTISCDQFKAGSAESMMTTAARVPLPNRSKATRVSFAPAMPSPPSTATTRSIAQDLRVSVNYPSGYDPSASRPTSYRTTMSSYRASTSDYDFDHVIDFAESARTSALSSSSVGSQHKRKDAMSRISNGSLGVPDDDDDGSVYSRESGSHESPWEIAKARVRARASLALPSASEELA